MSQDIPQIRSFRPEDAPACQRLYSEGLISGGKIADNDTGLDLDDIESVYMKTPGNHFWVAEMPDRGVIGMIGVQHHDEGVGVIRRLRVADSYKGRRFGRLLLDVALRYCHENGYLKITLDTFIDPDLAIQLFEKFHFRLDRKRTVAGKNLMYFYLDLYGRDAKQGHA
ncbi:MAG TPA: GNAT family N-acetyltransferase [Tepidisphaeraceae bacterium]|jgi:GNAT superfamily N-acetyltransferase|nr:GNAT family N-acetyltransferase [Tepidisphaeraceae bacterium]